MRSNIKAQSIYRLEDEDASLRVICDSPEFKYKKLLRAIVESLPSCEPVAYWIKRLETGSSKAIAEGAAERAAILGPTRAEWRRLNLLVLSIASTIRETGACGAKLDRAVRRYASHLPARYAASFVLPFLRDKRKSRRAIALTALRKAKLNSEIAEHIWLVYAELTDREILYAAARNPFATQVMGVPRMLETLSDGTGDEKNDEYWRMRIIQDELLRDSGRAAVLADKFDREFVWAVGRLGRHCFLAATKRLAMERRGDLNFLDLYIWTLKSLKAKEELEELARCIRADLNKNYVGNHELGIRNRLRQK